MSAESDIAALDDGGENTVAEVRQALVSVLERADLGFVWQSYEPTWEATSSDPAIANGAIIGRYAKMGDLIVGSLRIQFGSDTSAGSGTYFFGLPEPSASPGVIIGSALILDSGQRWYQGEARVLRPDEFSQEEPESKFVIHGKTNDHEITQSGFGSGDQILVQFVYEPGSSSSSLDSQLPIGLSSASVYPGNPVAQGDTGDWDSTELREIGQVIFDPETEMWVACYTGLSGSTSKVGLSFSEEGVSGWEPDADNPISGAVDAEDPYLAKNTDGTLYRDSSGRALLFTEAKSGSTQLGVDLWRSSPDTLDGWTFVGTVLDKTDEGWASRDVSSPVVVHDGERLVMLFEGRSVGNEGQIGVVVSEDEGESWSTIGDPIIVQGSGWNSGAVVPDDIILVDGVWVLTVHGLSGTTWTAGRYTTADNPADWDEESFTEMAGNPFYRFTDSVMCWGNDPTKVVRLSPDGQRVEVVDVVKG